MLPTYCPAMTKVLVPTIVPDTFVSSSAIVSVLMLSGDWMSTVSVHLPATLGAGFASALGGWGEAGGVDCAATGTNEHDRTIIEAMGRVFMGE